jgi:hypothetical protein
MNLAVNSLTGCVTTGHLPSLLALLANTDRLPAVPDDPPLSLPEPRNPLSIRYQ